MRPRRARPVDQSGQRKSIPNPNRIRQTNAANEAGQETRTKVVKQGNPFVRIDPQRASFKNIGEGKGSLLRTRSIFCFLRQFVAAA